MNARKFKIEDLERMDFNQLLLLKEMLRQKDGENLQARMELDEWMEGYVFKNADRLNLNALTNYQHPQAGSVKVPQQIETEKSAEVAAAATAVRNQGLFAEKKPARKSALEEFFDEQENAYCPVM